MPDNQGQYPYPIITINPYANVWSGASSLYDRHLQDNHKQMRPMVGIIKVDGKVYRFMGSGELPDIMIAGMSYDEEWEGRYTFTKPPNNWLDHDFDDTDWDVGLSPFGTPRYHSESYRQINTLWCTPTIWVRRKIEINENIQTDKNLYLKFSHDDVFELYINGILIVQTGYEWGEDKWIEIPQEVIETFHTGNIVIAAKGSNLGGEALLDFGIYVSENVQKEWNGKYTFSNPNAGWQEFDFDDSGWEIGKAPFGTPQDYLINTVWNTPEIWIRREITISQENLENDLILSYSHDDVFDLYVNGVQLVRTGFEWNKDRRVTIPDSLKKSMKGNKLLVTAHCQNLRGGALVDFDVQNDAVASQKSVDVQATQTCYSFECGPVELQLSFTAPFLLDNLEALSNPINYISYKIMSLDEIEHDVAVYFEISPGWMLQKQHYTTELYENDGLLFIKTGLEDQQLFTFDKENDTPLWGYVYLCSDKFNTSMSMGEPYALRKQFVDKSNLVSFKSVSNQPYAAFSKSYGKIKDASDKIIIGYDDVFSIQYWGNNLRPFWNRKDDKKMEQVLNHAFNDYNKMLKACNILNKQLRTTHNIFNFRELLSSFWIVEDEADGLLLFSPNGVTDMLRSSSLFLSYNCELLKAQLTPLLLYCKSDKWEPRYPPSNMGNYPLVNGFISSSQSSVDVASNMLFLLSMITAIDGNTDYIEQYWSTITLWNEFLQQNRGNPVFESSVDRGVAAYSYMRNALFH